MPEHRIEGCCATATPCKATSMVEKAQFHVVDVHIIVQNFAVEVANLIIATMKTQIQAPVDTPHLETLHLETPKPPSSSTY